MKPEQRTVKLEDLVPHPSNPRRGNVDLIAESLEHLGQYRTIVVNEEHDGRLIVLAGNHTVAAARKLGWDELEVGVISVDEETAQRIVLVDNRANDLSTYDDNVLLSMIENLSYSTDKLLATGFDDNALTDMMHRLTPPSLADLAAEYGINPNEEEAPEEAWPAVKFQVPPDTHRRFWTALNSFPGETLTDRVEAMLDHTT